MPASSAALRASRAQPPSGDQRALLAKVTTRMLFAVATPTHRMVPISAGTLGVVPLTKSIHTMPASAPGSAVKIKNGSSQDWKLITSTR